MSAAANGTNGISTPPTSEGEFKSSVAYVPDWLTLDCFKSILQTDVGEYSKVLSFSAGSLIKPGENMSSILLRVSIELLISDGGPTKSVSYIVKMNFSNPSMSSLIDSLMLFPKEQEMYGSIIPKFEALYKEAGKTVSFAPKYYKFPRDPPVDYLLLEDISKRGFRCANRLHGLDLVHMKEVLTKLAEFHAASACLQEHSGNYYTEHFLYSIFTERNRPLLETLNNKNVFLSHLRKWKDCGQYADKLADIDSYLVDKIIQAAKFNTSEFNVLNHGDLWINNIMFQYDAFGKIKETYFIDFQIGKYGSPAYDLYYLILTSAQPDIKLSHFDYFIKFYHDHLIENLKLLHYHRPLPKLRNLHISLLKNGLSAYSVVSKILPFVMLDTHSLGNVSLQDEDKLKAAMFSNPKYVKLMETIMPWLDNKGLLDFS